MYFTHPISIRRQVFIELSWMKQSSRDDLMTFKLVIPFDDLKRNKVLWIEVWIIVACFVCEAMQACDSICMQFICVCIRSRHNNDIKHMINTVKISGSLHETRRVKFQIQFKLALASISGVNVLQIQNSYPCTCIIPLLLNPPYLAKAYWWRRWKESFVSVFLAHMWYFNQIRVKLFSQNFTSGIPPPTLFPHLYQHNS